MTKVYLTVGLKFFIERKETPFTVKVCVKVKVTFPLHLKGMLQQIWGVISLKKGRLIAGLPNDIAYIAWIKGEILIAVTSTTSHDPYKKRRLS